MNKRLQGVKDYIESIRPSMEEFLELGYFDITVVYLEAYYGTDGEEDHGIVATTSGLWEYRTATIQIYLLAAVAYSNEELEKMMMHEYTHVLLLPEQSLIDNRFIKDTIKDKVTENEHTVLTDINYKLLEMSTENVSRLLYSAWQQNKQLELI